MEAAFFDLDKTVISKSSVMAFAGPFRRAGLLRRRSLANAAWQHVLYQHWGAGPKRLTRMQQSVLAVTTGWPQAEVRRLVRDHLADVLDPIVFGEARDLIAEHRRAGRAVFLVSAAPNDLVIPIGERLGTTASVASRPVLDGQGRYAGQLEQYAFGPHKAELMAELARQQGIDLDRSYAYSDSATDLPMLEVVGHPVVVNPDRALRRLAEQRGWPIERFTRLPGGEDRMARPLSTGWRAVRAVAALTLTGSAGALWLRYRIQHRPA